MKKVFACTLCVTLCLTMSGCCCTFFTEQSENRHKPIPDAVRPTTVTTIPSQIIQEEALYVPSTALELMETIWNSYDESEKFFAMGGDYNNIVDSAPGNVNVQDPDSMQALFACDSYALTMVESAASIIHAMNANTFTGVAYRLYDKSDQDEFETAIKASIAETQWMCGFPEKLFIARFDHYVVVAYGSADLIPYFSQQFNSCYEDIPFVWEMTDIA